jgi:Fe-S cluster assembly protein SufD
MKLEESIQGYAKLRDKLPGQGLSWLEKRRAEALAQVSKDGLPTSQDENWRFTSVEPLLKTTFKDAPAAPAKSLIPPAGTRLTFLNGRYSAEHSKLGPLPSGAWIGSLAAALKAEPARLEPFLKNAQAEQAFAALNTAFFDDGAVIFAPKDAVLEPIHLVFSSGSGMAHFRVLVVAERGAKVTLIEEYASESKDSYFNNVVTDVVLGEGAALDRVKLQRESDSAFHVATTRVRQARDSRFFNHCFGWGGSLVRNDVRISLDGEGAECELNGLYLAGGRQHVDNHTWIEHNVPHGTSRELYKGVLDGHARAVFNGAIHVEPAAQKTSALVYNKNLLLSEDGLVNTKPEFKINANDVQCKHGATIGQLSADSLFYLRARGISEEEARRLLVYAFASEMVGKVPLEPVREALTALLQERAHV